MAGLIVILGCAIVNVAFWFPLQYPPRWIGALVSFLAPTSCRQYAPDAWQYTACGWGLALFALSGTIIVAALLFVFRTAIRRTLHGAFRRLPPETSFLWPPLIVTLVFTLAWASIPFHSFTRPGIVWDGFFPTLVGVFSWALLRYRRPLFRRMPQLMAKRDRLPEWAKYAIAFAVVVAAAWAITRFLSPPPFFEKRWYELYPPARDQLVALASLLVTFLLWAPRVRAARKTEVAA